MAARNDPLSASNGRWRIRINDLQAYTRRLRISICLPPDRKRPLQVYHGLLPVHKGLTRARNEPLSGDKMPMQAGNGPLRAGEEPPLTRTERLPAAHRALPAPHRAWASPTGASSQILRYAPGVLAFSGKNAARGFLGRRIHYGRQVEPIDHLLGQRGTDRSTDPTKDDCTRHGGKIAQLCYPRP